MQKFSTKENPRVYFDIQIGSDTPSRVQFELFQNITPKTAENFRALCVGDKGKCRRSSHKLHFLNSVFHRIIPGFMAQGGDYTRFDGTGGESIYGPNFKDENFTLTHSEPFLLSMANSGPNTNGSQFFITFDKTPHLNRKHTVFGRVEKGHDILRKMERLPTNNADKPKMSVKIVKCGQLIKKSDLMAKQTAETQAKAQVEKKKEQQPKVSQNQPKVAQNQQKVTQNQTQVKQDSESGSGSDSEDSQLDSGSDSDNEKLTPGQLFKKSNENQQQKQKTPVQQNAENGSLEEKESEEPNQGKKKSGSDSDSEDEVDEKALKKFDMREIIRKEKLEGLQKAKENEGTISKKDKKKLKQKDRKKRLNMKMKYNKSN